MQTDRKGGRPRRRLQSGVMRLKHPHNKCPYLVHGCVETCTSSLKFFFLFFFFSSFVLLCRVKLSVQLVFWEPNAPSSIPLGGVCAKSGDVSLTSQKCRWDSPSTAPHSARGWRATDPPLQLVQPAGEHGWYVMPSSHRGKNEK